MFRNTWLEWIDVENTTTIKGSLIQYLDSDLELTLSTVHKIHIITSWILTTIASLPCTHSSNLGDPSTQLHLHQHPTRPNFKQHISHQLLHDPNHKANLRYRGHYPRIRRLCKLRLLSRKSRKTMSNHCGGLIPCCYPSAIPTLSIRRFSPQKPPSLESSHGKTQTHPYQKLLED